MSQLSLNLFFEGFPHLDLTVQPSSNVTNINQFKWKKNTCELRWESLIHTLLNFSPNRPKHPIFGFFPKRPVHTLLGFSSNRPVHLHTLYGCSSNRQDITKKILFTELLSKHASPVLGCSSNRQDITKKIANICTNNKYLVSIEYASHCMHVQFVAPTITYK